MIDERATILITEFKANRIHSMAVAYRMLGSRVEADDGLQETWLTLNRSDMNEVGNISGWLRTVVACICLDAAFKKEAARGPLDLPACLDIKDGSAFPLSWET